jgi:hypothetical protein
MGGVSGDRPRVPPTLIEERPAVAKPDASSLLRIGQWWRRIAFLAGATASLWLMHDGACFSAGMIQGMLVSTGFFGELHRPGDEVPVIRAPLGFWYGLGICAVLLPAMLLVWFEPSSPWWFQALDGASSGLFGGVAAAHIHRNRLKRLQ